MSEDRTQPPSKRRRQLAREQGQTAHSPELTAAAGWLVALVILGTYGSELTRTLVELTRGSLDSVPVVWLDASSLVDHLRSRFLRLALPLGTILLGFAAGAFATHQLQVRGIWAVNLLAPDPARLWKPGQAGLGLRFEQIAWSVLKAVILVAIVLWMIRAEWTELQRLSTLELNPLADVAAWMLLRPASILAGVLLLVGLADFGLRYMRFEAMLRTTPEEQREDQRILEGDLSLRAKRRRLARSWRGDAPEFLAGASVLLCGPGGLTLVLAGGPPPRRVSVRAAAQGSTGLQLRRSNRSTRLPQLDAPDLARRVARHVASAKATPQTLPAELIVELVKLWPAA